MLKCFVGVRRRSLHAREARFVSQRESTMVVSRALKTDQSVVHDLLLHELSKFSGLADHRAVESQSSSVTPLVMLRLRCLAAKVRPANNVLFCDLITL